MDKIQAILASKSPRRAEILKMMKVKFKVEPSKIEEKINPKTEQNQIAIAVSKEKAKPNFFYTTLNIINFIQNIYT